MLQIMPCEADMIADPVNEMDVQAMIDSQLSREEEKRVRRELLNNPFLRKEYAKLAEQKKLLKMWWDSEPRD